MTDMTVANTILAQLGGRRFILMTGARNLGGTSNALSFKLPTGTTRNKANYVRITLNAFDTYDVEFLKIRKFESEVVGYKEGIYCDQLQEVFTRETGLVTSLGTMGRSA